MSEDGRLCYFNCMALRHPPNIDTTSGVHTAPLTFKSIVTCFPPTAKAGQVSHVTKSRETRLRSGLGRHPTTPSSNRINIQMLLVSTIPGIGSIARAFTRRSQITSRTSLFPCLSSQKTSRLHAPHSRPERSADWCPRASC